MPAHMSFYVKHVKSNGLFKIVSSLSPAAFPHLAQVFHGGHQGMKIGLSVPRPNEDSDVVVAYAASYRNPMFCQV